MFSKKCFTIIEALIIVAILSALISLLLPSLNSIKNSQQRLLCLNNTRVIYTASSLYSLDHEDFFPRRLNASRPNRVVGHGFDFNKSFIYPYARDRNLFFCQSTLIDARNPQHPLYTRFNVTYSYFHDYKLAYRWKASIPKLEKTSTNYDKLYPLWGCLTLSTSSGLWFGHDRPIQPIEPEGQNACFIDGSAKWNDFEDLEVFISFGPQSFYWPKPY